LKHPPQEFHRAKSTPNSALEPVLSVVSAPLQVYVISRPMFDHQSFGRFLATERTTWSKTSSATDAELLVEVSGRVCYMSFGDAQHSKDTATYIQNLLRNGHESVLEHAVWSLLLTGVSRAFTHQLVRHRVGFGFSQLSQQYHDETDAVFVPPVEIERDRTAFVEWATAMQSVRKSYRHLVQRLNEQTADGHLSPRERKRAIRSAARSILPNCIETKIAFTVNARALRHFLDVRGSIVGDLEMRRVCAAILSVMKTEAPLLFADFEGRATPDGAPIVCKTKD
jgi:thymidylate synthase (FAD)